MAKTDVILTNFVMGLGAESDKVTVTAGYARNYLIPNGLAVPATRGNERYLAVLEQRRGEREAQELATMQELKGSLDKLPPLVIKVKTGEMGKMYGSVTAGAISDELKNQFGVELDRRKIQLDKSIRELGEFQVPLKLHADIGGELKVQVESTTPIAPSVEREGDAKTEASAPKA